MLRHGRPEMLTPQNSSIALIDIRSAMIGLIELVSHPSDVAAEALLAQGWPEVTVEEGSLRLQLVSLRNALCGGKHGAIAPGRGEAVVSSASDWVEEIVAAVRFPKASLPAGLVGMFGRERGRRV